MTLDMNVTIAKALDIQHHMLEMFISMDTSICNTFGNALTHTPEDLDLNNQLWAQVTTNPYVHPGEVFKGAAHFVKTYTAALTLNPFVVWSTTIRAVSPVEVVAPNLFLLYVNIGSPEINNEAHHHVESALALNEFRLGCMCCVSRLHNLDFQQCMSMNMADASHYILAGVRDMLMMVSGFDLTEASVLQQREPAYNATVYDELLAELYVYMPKPPTNWAQSANPVTGPIMEKQYSVYEAMYNAMGARLERYNKELNKVQQ